MADLLKLSRALSHALRHEPWLYELELDKEGWVPVQSLIEGLRGESFEWGALTSGDLAKMIEQSEKKRHEMRDGKIRALYGHSVSQRLQLEEGRPPAILYHGTAPATAEIIRAEGLRPMGRQYVHLSADLDTALKVGKRKARKPSILEIASGLAHDAGIKFYHGNELVWLADSVPTKFIR